MQRITKNKLCMINRDFLNILNEISRKEVSFHKAEEENEHLFGHVIGFLLYLRYKEIISFKSIKDKEDISSAIYLSSNNPPKVFITEAFTELFP